MNVRHSIMPTAGVFIATITLDDHESPLSGREADALSHLGEPLVQMGGVFTGSGVTFTLPTVDIRVPSGLPYQHRWSLVDYPDAELRAQVWLESVLLRIGSAMALLVSQDSSTPVSQVSTVGRVVGVTTPSAESVGALASWMNI